MSAPVPPDPLLAVYLLVEPLVAGRLVVDVGPRPEGAAARLRAAGAREVLAVDGPSPRLPVPDRGVDLAVCATRLSALPSDVERHRWLAELRRVLRPGGFCVARLAVGALGALEDPDGAVQDLLRHHFTTVDVIREAPLSAVSFLVPGADDVAVSEALASIDGEPTHLIAFACDGAQRPWELPESLLVPTGPGGAGGVAEEVVALRGELAELADRLRAALVEREELRESAMTMQDRLDRQEEALSALRRETERHLRQISEDGAALELAAIERERAERRAASAERALEALAAQSRERAAEVAALEQELARLRGAAAS